MTAWLAPSSLDRRPDARDESSLDAQWAGAAVLHIDPQGRVEATGGRPRLDIGAGARRPNDLFLGRVMGRAWFARIVPEARGEAMTWRDSAEEDYDVLAAAVSLTRWHALAPRCEACGELTEVSAGGAQRRCVACHELLFPRTDPCVIVAVTDPDDRLLLARQASWPVGRRSVIAGFMEAGESAEQAVHREVHEEVGVRLAGVTYVSSQPWPMPRSLMLGFEARASDSQIRVDGDEIAEGAYYTRPELVAAVDAGRIALPGRASIARELVERWLSRC